MTPKNWMVVLGLAAITLANGCSKNVGSSAVPNFVDEFKTANAELKAKVDFVADAYKTNNYVGAISTLQTVLITPGLSPKQQKAVEDMLETANASLYKAVDKGDANAIQAVEALRTLRQRGR